MIYVIIPVHNRLNYTKQIINCLRDQKVEEEIELIVINDGSSDGTNVWLANQKMSKHFMVMVICCGGSYRIRLKYVF